MSKSGDGEPKSRFNRRGRGAGEYLDAGNIHYDEITDELFVCIFFGADFIQVYSSVGEYKRTITVPEARISMMVSFDKNSLLVYNMNPRSSKVTNKQRLLPSPMVYQGPLLYHLEERYDSPFLLISKKDGTVIDVIKLPEKDIAFLDPEGAPFGVYPIVQCPEGVFLCNPDTDTVFIYGKDRSLTPVMYKIPPGLDSDPMVILHNCVDVGRYQFMELVTMQRENGRFPMKYYFRDKSSGEIFRQKIVLPDYKGKEFHIGIFGFGHSFEDGVRIYLDLLELKQAYRENRLSGKLKELVATLKEDDNDVLMMVNFK